MQGRARHTKRRFYTISRGGIAKMAKFGRFHSGRGEPIETYEGDFMTQDKEFVKIFKRPTNENETQRQVAAIHLDQGQSVRELP